MLTFGFLQSRAQVAFHAVIEPSVIYQNEYATLRIKIDNSNDIKNLKLPSFGDFNIISGPSQETGMSNINGVSSSYMALSYVLEPRKPGSFNLGSVSATISGKQFSSGPLKLTVKKGQGNSGTAQQGMQMPLSLFDDIMPPHQDYDDYYLKPGESVAQKVSDNMHVRLQTNKTSCYVGEPIVATYKLYTRLESQSKMSKAPSFNGFSVVDMMRPDEMNQSIETLNGREYNTYVIRKSQLYPLQDGIFEVEPATIDNEVKLIKADGKSNYGPDNIIIENVTLSSKPVSVHVKPLPTQGKPANFNGAVGRFEIDARLQNNNLSTDDAGKLVVTIGGYGNLHLLTAPDIEWPVGLDAFDPKVKEQIDVSQVPEAGNKIFEIPFTINKPGPYTIPAISFSFFDPASASYKTVTSKPIHFTVITGTGQPKFDVDTLGKKRTVSLSEKIFSHRSWIVAALALLLLAGVGIWLRLDAKKKKQQKSSSVPHSVEEPTVEKVLEPQNPLAQSAALLNTEAGSGFYSMLNKELKTWLAQKFSLPLQDITSKKIIAAIDNAGIDNTTALELQNILQEIEWQLFTPSAGTHAMQQVYSRAQAVLQTICVCSSAKHDAR